MNHVLFTMPYHSSLAIANEFLRRAQRANRPMTHMHIQKLVYLAHGWNIAVSRHPLIEDDIEAWEYGPVIRKLYDALRQYGRGPILREIRWGDDTPFPFDDSGEAIAELTSEERAVVDRVWDVYGVFAAFQLSALTHADNSPWHRTYIPGGRNRVINNDLIGDYFADLAAHAE